MPRNWRLVCPRGESPPTYMPVISGELTVERRCVDAASTCVRAGPSFSGPWGLNRWAGLRGHLLAWAGSLAGGYGTGCQRKEPARAPRLPCHTVRRVLDWADDQAVAAPGPGWASGAPSDRAARRAR